ncbi:hypothetical protein WSK_4136 [Novosphingobium sp. Rr 2-17]|uniref:hypothetical protein n=1 Tax=Novosphingobium sp. Rr 2-17 TaxID=555793 RepID=UPI000269A262|nr:hypothetical protein [Novosphingobium sp. Rr 2-17]EIZ77296.1 hypothetical protein WSK_4136 [Novosphingobium sp. Rr 2-17]
MRPWDYNPELTEERLIRVAQLIERGRNDAVDRHEPAIGGDSWTKGVCAYSYAKHQIIQAAGTPGFEWLSVINDGMRFQFGIGKAPMRFWRGDFAEPSQRIATATPMEQFLLELEPGVPTAGVLFRIGLTTDEEGAMLEACFAALRNGAAETIWPISLVDADPLVVVLDDTRPEGRELPPPTIGDRSDDETAEGHSEERSDR